MFKGLLSLITGSLCLLAVTVSYGQKTFLRVIDQKTREPIGFCHVCLEGVKTGAARYALTSAEGVAELDWRERSVLVISYVGYKTYTDTINPGKSMTIELQPAILNMDEVVVTAQYSPERADKSIYRVGVISARQIEQKAATNMADLLKDQPSMRVGQDAVFGTTLKIQGLSGENVKFLQDGVPMIGRMNGNFDLTQINLHNTDHIEVIEGPMSVIYGSNALAGVINIITRESAGSFLHTRASAYYESVGQYNFNASLTINRGKHGISFDGGRNFFGGYSPFDTARSQLFKPKRQFFLSGYYAFRTGKVKLKIAGDYFNELLLDRGSPEAPYYETAFDNEFSTRRSSLKADVSWKISRFRNATLLAAYSDWTRIRQTWFKELTTLEKNPVNQAWARDTNAINAVTARGTYSVNNPSRWFNFQAGFDISHEAGSGEKIEGNYQTIGDYALFASIRIDPWRREMVSGSDTGSEAVLSLQPGIRLISNSRYVAPVVYALSARWAITGQTLFRFSYARGFRAPALKEIYLSFIDFNHHILGNPELKAETSHNFNVNLGFTPKPGRSVITVDVMGFCNLISNVILLAQAEPNTIRYSYRNVSRYKSAGVQLNGSMTLHPSLNVQAGFAITGTTGSLHDSLPFDPFRWSPEVTLTSRYLFRKYDLTVALFYKFTGDTPQPGFSENGIDWYTISSYHTMDITMTKGFWNNRIYLSAGVRNLFDVTTIPTTGSAFTGGHSGGSGAGAGISWGRTLFLKLQFQINHFK